MVGVNYFYNIAFFIKLYKLKDRFFSSFIFSLEYAGEFPGLFGLHQSISFFLFFCFVGECIAFGTLRPWHPLSDNLYIEIPTGLDLFGYFDFPNLI